MSITAHDHRHSYVLRSTGRASSVAQADDSGPLARALHSAAVLLILAAIAIHIPTSAEAGELYGEVRFKGELFKSSTFTMQDASGNEFDVGTDAGGQYIIVIPDGLYKVIIDDGEPQWVRSYPGSQRENINIQGRQ